MANVYRVTILSYEPAADNQIMADSVVERRTSINPETWIQVTHRTMVLGAAEVIAITQDEVLTNGQKRLAIQALIKEKALAFGVADSDQAWADMQDLYSNQTPPGAIPPVTIRQ
jgi:hypothetical protein